MDFQLNLFGVNLPCNQELRLELSIRMFDGAVVYESKYLANFKRFTARR